MGVGNPFKGIIFSLLLLSSYVGYGKDLPCNASRGIYAMLTPVYKLSGPVHNPYGRNTFDAEFFAEVYPIFTVEAIRRKDSDTTNSISISIYKKRFLKKKWGGLPVIDWSITKIEPDPDEVYAPVSLEEKFRFEKVYKWGSKKVPRIILIHVRVMDSITARWHRCVYRIFTPFPKVTLLRD